MKLEQILAEKNAVIIRKYEETSITWHTPATLFRKAQDVTKVQDKYVVYVAVADGKEIIRSVRHMNPNDYTFSYEVFINGQKVPMVDKVAEKIDTDMHNAYIQQENNKKDPMIIKREQAIATKAQEIYALLQDTNSNTGR